MSTTASDLEKAIEKLTLIKKKITDICAKPVDIHIFTSDMGGYYKPFYEIDQAYKLSSNTQKLDNIIDEILKMCPTHQKSNVTKILNTIKTTSGADKETKVNLQELFIRTWSLASLAKKSGLSVAFTLVIANLEHNVTENGGCIPGIAARLIQPYTALVLFMLEKKAEYNNKPKIFTPSFQQHVYQKDSDLELGITLSISEQEQKNKPLPKVRNSENKNKNPDRELELTPEQILEQVLELSKLEEERRQLSLIDLKEKAKEDEDEYEKQLNEVLRKSKFDK